MAWINKPKGGCMYQKQPDLSTREGRMAHITEWLKRLRAAQLVRELERKATKERRMDGQVRNRVSGFPEEHIGYPRPDLLPAEEEVCTDCGKKLGFPKTLPCDDPRRYANGAVYDHGGQLCGDCARKAYPVEVRFDMGCG